MIERHEKFLGHFCPKTNCFPQIFYIMQRFFRFLWWKVERKKKSIVMAWNKQKPCQLCIHECSQKSIIKVDLHIHCCVIIWNSFYYWAVIWAFQGLICLQTAGYSFLTVWTCQLCNIKLYTHFHSSLDMFSKPAFFTMYNFTSYLLFTLS